MAFTAGQRCKYFALISKAWWAHCEQADLDYSDKTAESDWRHRVNMEATGCASIKEMNHTDDFDSVMLELAIVAGDVYWINRLSSAAERRIRWVIETQFIPDLEFLKKEAIGWAYIEGICRQSRTPVDLDDCPAELLVRVLQMVDTHIRRLAKKEGVKVSDLPSGYFRAGVRPGAKAKAKYRHERHHRRQHTEQLAH